jgi:hypothetical protein
MIPIKDLLISELARAGRAATMDSPATHQAIADLEARCGALPSEIRELVLSAAGFSFGEFTVRFIGDYPFELKELFSGGIPIATDGTGNFWVVDVGVNGTWRSVFFVAHDPPVVLLQARDLGEFVTQVFELPHRGLPSTTAIAQVWNDKPYTMTRAQALMSPDTAVRTFALQLDDRFVIVDLRSGEEGSGFVWGGSGPNTQIHRAGEDLVFAIEQKKGGVMSRLFSRYDR